MLSILSVAYPLAEVSADSAGGAEQILAALDRGLVAAGHTSLVIAPAGSTVAGELVALPLPAAPFDETAKRAAQAYVRDAMAFVLAHRHVDLVHCHGLDFAAYLPTTDVPVLATLHLPVSWYAPEALAPARPGTWLNCVSHTQHASCRTMPNLLSPILNGIPVEAFEAVHAKRRFALVLGRICPEKGTHIAIEAAQDAGLCLVIAGQVYPYAEHLAYFDEMVRPRLSRTCRYVGPVGFARKRRLLSAALCLLAPSLVPETSSLVAREAAACGTPVIAFPVGAMAEAIEPDRTGFLVRDPAEMAAAISNCGRLDPEVCRTLARDRFSERTMTAAYFELYARLAHRGAGAGP